MTRKWFLAMCGGCAIPVVSAAALLVALGYFAFPPRPSSDSLVRNLHEHKGNFERLATMAREESGALFIGRYFGAETGTGWPADIEVDKGRLKEYRRLLGKVGGRRSHIFVSSERELWMNIEAWGWGVLPHFSPELGYAYRRQPPERLVEDIDTCEVGEHLPTPYQHLHGNWYLYYYEGE